MARQVAMTYVGGPTAVLEFGGLRFLTDPTFDPAGSEYPSGSTTLKKLAEPAIAVEQLGAIDVVLLSHDHHSDNLDDAGRQMLAQSRVITTLAGAERLRGNAEGLANWRSLQIAGGSGTITITGTPCRHGPAGMDRGPVTGFVLSWSEDREFNIYVSGDTVWYEGVAEVAKRFEIDIAVLFMGAALVPQITPWPLTMTAEGGVAAAQAFSKAIIVPMHYEGWAHFSESREVIEDAFRAAGLEKRVRWLEPARRVGIIG